jgi:hypothetical protein
MTIFPYCKVSFLLGHDEQDPDPEFEQSDDGFFLA